MGYHLNKSMDKGPYELAYGIVKRFIRKIEFERDNTFDLRPAFEARTLLDVDEIRQYLRDIICHPSNMKGWKLPETTFLYPWLVDLYPEVYYIWWLRDPRRNAFHLSDNFLSARRPFLGIGHRDFRFWSWLVQYRIVRQTSMPERFITIRMEDFLNHQDRELERLSDFLGVKLIKLEVDPRKAEYQKCVLPTPVAAAAAEMGY